MTKTLKVGVIGVGGIARTHMPGWEASPLAEVVAGADPVEESLKGWGEKWNVKRLETDAKALINDPDIDIIDVCTPSMFHAPLSIAALEAGKHVLCEKPLAPTPDDIRKMIAARDKSGKLLMTAQHERYQPHSRLLKAEVDTGSLGDVYHARSWYLRRNQVPMRPSFLQKCTSGGGPCIDIGVHILDTTLWLMGHPKPVTVTGVSVCKLLKKPGAWSAWGMNTVPEGVNVDVEDFAAAFVKFADGQSLILETSWMLHHPKTEQAIWLYGTEGGARWPDGMLYRTNNQTKQTYDIELTTKPGGLEAHAAECVDFAQAVAEGKSSPVPPEQSLAVQSILHGLYESQDTGQEVRITM